MTRILIFALFLLFAFVCEARPQAISTKILRFEIDGKAVKNNYRVYFLANDTWVESQTNENGFVVPAELSSNKELTVLIEFGELKLIFSDIRISKFEQDWVVGIDNKPFSEKNVEAKERKSVNLVYYIEFVGRGLETRLIIKERKRKLR